MKKSEKAKLVEKLTESWKERPLFEALDAYGIQKMVDAVHPTEQSLLDTREAFRKLAEVVHTFTEEQLRDIALAGGNAYLGAEALSEGKTDKAQEFFGAMPSIPEMSPALIAAMMQQGIAQHEAAKLEQIKAKKARRAADALHDKPGGTRSKADAIRAIWASGKYSSRGLCAEQECAALNMSYDAARRALRNTPKPP